MLAEPRDDCDNYGPLRAVVSDAVLGIKGVLATLTKNVSNGYCTAACCEAGVAAQGSGEKVKVSLETKPGIYR